VSQNSNGGCVSACVAHALYQAPQNLNDIGEFANSILQRTIIDNKCISKLIKIGDKVRIVKPNLQWSFLKDSEGEIMNLYQYGKKSHWEAFILVKDSKIKEQVIDKNKNKKINPKNDISWAPIYIYQIETITSDCKAHNNKRKNNDCEYVCEAHSNDTSVSRKRSKPGNGSSKTHPNIIVID
jgi:hypothetical protein